jgi:hypothetical protein
MSPPNTLEGAAVLATVKVRPGDGSVCLAPAATADLDGVCARRPVTSAVGAGECLRRGRTKEWPLQLEERSDVVG